ncbi:MAG: phenylacetate--CoA ligase family protein [Parcubacteria group bacterium]|nr:phenylacetate--CoA ligase family protein [Parcubacteria group bacterium]
MTKKTFAKLKKRLSEVWQSRRSDFYRRHFSKHGFKPEFVKNPADWQRVPFLNRSDLQETNLFKRLFDDWENLTSLRVSSGTTSNRFFIIPRNVPKPGSPSKSEFLAAFGIKGFMPLFQYQRSYYYTDTLLRKKGVVFVAGDPHDLNRSATIVKKLRIDSIAGSPGILIFFQPFLKKIGALPQIKFLSIEGEYCTPFQWQEIGRLYPGARRWQVYALSETEIFDVGLPILSGIKLNHYLLNEKYLFLEIVKPDSGKLCAAGEEGEMVLTSLYSNLALPLIRYRTGDLGAMLNESNFKVSGRANFDVLRLNGCEFRADDVAAALSRAFNLGNPDFQMHFFENGGRYDILMQIAASKLRINPFTKQALLRFISCGPNINLEQALNNNLFHSFQIEIADEFRVGEKLRRFIRHESPL